VLRQGGLNEEVQNNIMQLLDKRRWEEALRLTQQSGASEKCLTSLKSLIEISGKDTEKILQAITKIVKDFEDAVASLDNLREILSLINSGDGKIDILLEAGFARGLEYYTGIIFEAYIPELGIALAGGGRYDRLVELFGGDPTPAVGVAHGIDRIVLSMEREKLLAGQSKEKHVIIIPLKDEMRAKAFSLASTLRNSRIHTDVEVMGRGISSALSDADRRGLRYSILLGPEEAKEGKIILRDMKKREQRIVEMKEIVDEIVNLPG
jgi:histidyl-tRNA synthetase